MAFFPIAMGLGTGLQGLGRQLLSYEMLKRQDEAQGIFDRPLLAYQPAQVQALPPLSPPPDVMPPTPTPAREGEPRGVNVGLQRTMQLQPYEVVDRLPKMAPREGGIPLRGGRVFYPELSREGIMAGLRAKNARELAKETAERTIGTGKALAEMRASIAEKQERAKRQKENKTAFGLGIATGLIPEGTEYSPREDYTWIEPYLRHREREADREAQLRRTRLHEDAVSARAQARAGSGSARDANAIEDAQAEANARIIVDLSFQGDAKKAAKWFEAQREEWSPRDARIYRAILRRARAAENETDISLPPPR